MFQPIIIMQNLHTCIPQINLVVRQLAPAINLMSLLYCSLYVYNDDILLSDITYDYISPQAMINLK